MDTTKKIGLALKNVLTSDIDLRMNRIRAIRKLCRLKHLKRYTAKTAINTMTPFVVTGARKLSKDVKVRDLVPQAAVKFCAKELVKEFEAQYNLDKHKDVNPYVATNH